MGDAWTPLVLREVFYGKRRFEEFQERLGISRNLLTIRLKNLVKEELLVKVPYQERPVRYEYRLTDKGRDFFNVLAAMMQWGDKWLASGTGAPLELIDKKTGQVVQPLMVDAATGKPFDVRDLTARPGPGFPKKKVK
jgi:DNA-binding HxlR family transcriptional regulator